MPYFNIGRKRIPHTYDPIYRSYLVMSTGDHTMPLMNTDVYISYDSTKVDAGKWCPLGHIFADEYAHYFDKTPFYVFVRGKTVSGVRVFFVYAPGVNGSAAYKSESGWQWYMSDPDSDVEKRDMYLEKYGS